ncbi:MAG: hypothetical protein ACI9JD_003458 [Rhodococcus sp. (in: high G+C Gram-positive bacteria)]|jgi:hypothetical protein
MIILTDTSIRSSLVNASRKEKSDLTLPDGFGTIDFDALDYLGWRDPKMGRRAYAIVPTLDGETIGVLLVQAEATPRSRAQCSWCRDTRLPNEVVFYGAKLAGPAGRRGSTVGTLICRDFQCSSNVRNDPPAPVCRLRCRRCAPEPER